MAERRRSRPDKVQELAKAEAARKRAEAAKAKSTRERETHLEQYKQEQDSTRELFGRLMGWFAFSATINATLAVLVSSEEFSAIGKGLVPIILIIGNLAGAVFAGLIGRHCAGSRMRANSAIERLGTSAVDPELGSIPRVSMGVAFTISATKVAIAMAWAAGMMFQPVFPTSIPLKVDFGSKQSETLEQDHPATWVRDASFANTSFFEGSNKPKSGATINLNLGLDDKATRTLSRGSNALSIVAVAGVLGLAGVLFCATLWATTLNPTQPPITTSPETVTRSFLILSVGLAIGIYFAIRLPDFISWWFDHCRQG